MDHDSVYVGLSRVMQTNDIRLYSIHLDNADHLFIMKPITNLLHWDFNYNNDHEWISGGLHKILNTEKQFRLESLKAIKNITQSIVFKCGTIVEMMSKLFASFAYQLDQYHIDRISFNLLCINWRMCENPTNNITYL